MTAREQAREAATARGDVGDRYSAEYDPVRCADAASDVWEPIVRDLLELTDRLILDGGHEWSDEEDQFLDDVRQRAKEALGE